MSLSTDLRIHEQYGSPAAASKAAPSSGGSFSQALSAARGAGGGTNYEKYFQAAAAAYDVPVDLIKAVAKAESDFDPKAVSRCGAKGVMQLMPATARAMGVTDPFDPAQNIMGGTKYLRQMLDTFHGDVTKAIAAYNAGPNAVKKNGGMLSSQAGYVNKILAYAGSGVSASYTGGGEAIGSIRGGEAINLIRGGETVSISGDMLTREDLAELIVQAYRTDSSYNQEYVRMLMHQIFLKNANDREEEDTII